MSSNSKGGPGVIKKLPPSVSSLTRSCINIKNYAICVSELVCNSIDAGATCIAVRVDINSHRIQVVDNGHGIDEENLKVVAERHMTSKISSIYDLENHPEHFGFRGEALASIREVCGCLAISSRPSSSSSTFEKRFQEGRPGDLVCCEEKRPSAGTTVTVLDFMYNVPVRRKKVDEHFETEEVRSLLELIALVHPDVSISLRNDATGKVLLDSRHCRSTREVFAQLFGPVLADNLHPLSFDGQNGLQVGGYVSKTGHHSKSYQLIYVNKRIIKRTTLHKVVVNLLSWMLRQEKKQKYPFFVLNLCCPYAIYDMTLEPSKTVVEFKNWSTIEKIFEEALRHFMQEHKLEAPPEAVGKSKIDKVAAPKSTWISVMPKFPEPKLHLKRTTSGISAKRQVGKFDIVKEVLSKSNYDVLDSAGDCLEETWSTSMPLNFANASKAASSLSGVQNSSKTSNPIKVTAPTIIQALITTTDVRSPIAKAVVKAPIAPSKQSGWQGEAIKADLFGELCEAIKSSMTIFLSHFRKDKPPSQTSASSHSQNERGTTLTQDLRKMGVLNGEPPEVIFERHQEVNDLPFCIAEENGNHAIDLFSQPVEHFIMSPGLELDEALDHGTDRRFETDNIIVTSPLHCYYTSTPAAPPKEEKRMPDLQIFQHLTPSDPSYQHLIKAFSPKAASPAVTSPSLLSESAWQESLPPLTMSPAALYPVATQDYYTPEGQFETSQYYEASNDEPVETSPVANALAIFGDPEEDQEMATDKDLDQKRKICSPEDVVDAKKSRMSQDEWQLLEAGQGEKFFINARTGQVAEKVPESDAQFSIQERTRYMPFGTSPIMKSVPKCNLRMDSSERQELSQVLETRFSNAEEVAASVKWHSLQEMENQKHQLGFNDLIQKKVLDAGDRPIPELETPDLFGTEDFTKIRSVFGVNFQSSMLENAKVVGQFDKKCIIALADYDGGKSNLVLFIDQHAAHERIRLENLTRGYQLEQCFLSAPLHPPQHIILSKVEASLVLEFQALIQTFGIECELMSETEVRVFSVPLCFQNKHHRQCLKPSWKMDESVHKLLHQIINTLQETRGVCPAMPQELRDVLNSEACSGALKFNTSLGKSACADILEQLSKCQVPFQCAHGRNSVHPAFDLDKIKKREPQKPNISGFLKNLECLKSKI